MKPNRLASISFLTMAPGFLVVAQMNPPAPPFHRASTVMLHERVESLVVAGEIAWFGRESDVIAFDLKGGHELWKHKLDADGGMHAEHIAINRTTVFVSTDPKWNETNAGLFALDSRTGKLKWSLPRRGKSSDIGIGDGAIYTELAPFTSPPSTRVTERSVGPRD
jgi:outer membrane protein assembly factor BamB